VGGHREEEVCPRSRTSWVWIWPVGRSVIARMDAGGEMVDGVQIDNSERRTAQLEG
jgi:hypothetical protein